MNDDNNMLLSREGYVATITINRPDQRNAMASTMWRWLAERMNELNDDNDVRCVVIRGAGEKAFASGADISEFEVWTSEEKSRQYGLLIESALPEIEAEATELLARMTDNRMHIKIETQRETKAGHSLETLDIKIADELGTRNYEMYSGGEAFRINFAIRIALSKTNRGKHGTA